MPLSQRSGGEVVRYNETNMTSQHGQQGEPSAQILYCPSEFCRFKGCFQ